MTTSAASVYIQTCTFFQQSRNDHASDPVSRSAIKSSLLDTLHTSPSDVFVSTIRHSATLSLFQQPSIQGVLGKFNMAPYTCKRYCCSSFATYKDDIITKISNLSNDIHPIFRRSNFPHNSDEDYEFMLPSLRLASLMLQSDAALPFILKIFDREVHAGDNHSIPLSQYFFENMNPEWFAAWDNHLEWQSEQTEVNTQNRRRVSHILTHAANAVQFDVRDDDGLEGKRDGCCMERLGCLTKSMQRAFPRCVECYIWLGGQPLNVIRDYGPVTFDQDETDQEGTDQEEADREEAGPERLTEKRLTEKRLNEKILTRKPQTRVTIPRAVSRGIRSPTVMAVVSEISF